MRKKDKRYKEIIRAWEEQTHKAQEENDQLIAQLSAIRLRLAKAAEAGQFTVEEAQWFFNGQRSEKKTQARWEPTQELLDDMLTEYMPRRRTSD